MRKGPAKDIVDRVDLHDQFIKINVISCKSFLSLSWSCDASCVYSYISHLLKITMNNVFDHVNPFAFVKLCITNQFPGYCFLWLANLFQTPSLSLVEDLLEMRCDVILNFQIGSSSSWSSWLSLSSSLVGGNYKFSVFSAGAASFLNYRIC